MCLTTDLEYWKSSSRRLYVARQAEYEEIVKQKERMRLSLTLNRKRKTTRVDLTDEDDDDKMSKIESIIETVSTE